MSNLVTCQDCKFWSGQIGSENEWTKKRRSPITSKVLVCAVRGCPQPSLAALSDVDGRLSSALHECFDFIAA